MPSTVSMVLFYLMAASFGVGAGITTGTLVYNALGIVSTLLMICSLSVIEERAPCAARPSGGMGIAEEAGKTILAEAAKWITSSGLGTVLGAVAKEFFSGSSGYEKEVRQAMADCLEKVEAKVDALGKRLDTVTKNRDELRWKCYEARILAEQLAQRLSESVKPWTDPDESKEHL